MASKRCCVCDCRVTTTDSSVGTMCMDCRRASQGETAILKLCTVCGEAAAPGYGRRCLTHKSIQKCLECGGRSYSRYCSDECRRITVTCKWCRTYFVHVRSGGFVPKCCSERCRLADIQAAARMGENPCDNCGSMTNNRRGPHGRFCGVCREKRRLAARRHRSYLRRSRVSAARGDVTPMFEANLRAKARRCPMPNCAVRLTDQPYLTNSKELDHIVPLCKGGTHTSGNVRIICRACNQARPWDGSDYEGQLSLWCQNAEVAKSVYTRRRRKKVAA